MKTGAPPIPGHEINVEEQQRLEVDGLLPARVMHPVDAEDAARGLRLCDLTPAGVVVWGGGTQMRLGAPPRQYDVAFSTERMNRLLEYEPADLTCRVQAGMRLADLQRTLGEQGQRLPLDPPHPERATLGGMLAANTSGLSRARYGTVRDWVIGIAVAYPSGKVARAGGKVVKNVAGYDLMKLHTGALGTLGVVAEVNLKVQAIPQASLTLLGHFDRPAAAVAAALRLAHAYLSPAASIVLDRNALAALGMAPEGEWTMALKLEGYAKEVEAAKDLAGGAIGEAGGRADDRDIAAGFWDAARDWSVPAEQVVLLRAVLPMGQLPAILPAMPSDALVMLQPASGIAEVQVAPPAATSTLRQLRAAAGAEGQVLVAAAPYEIKRSLDIWGAPPSGFAVMRALKQALDPNGILNPGRFVGGI